MSDRQNLQEAVKALTKAKKENADKVSKAVAQVDTVRQVQTEQPYRQD
ncbi:unnamed protein product [marine sediment metagenome]|uniref:Uncharacterized protein n=1 Tax=marine sediment metagenome TaxID=412755 RepID=X1HRD9_9ZZZZ